MQNLVLIQVDELRQLIRDELAITSLVSEHLKAATKPINQRELCAFLGLSEPTVIRWRKKGKLPFLQVGGNIRYDVEAVLAALEGNKKTKKS